ncbi:MAG: hypothetical protein E7517_03575 [Ruminococcaceae bacterium]|nr:hypothetical protein [Oscillospiraceae bacterium]
MKKNHSIKKTVAIVISLLLLTSTVVYAFAQPGGPGGPGGGPGGEGGPGGGSSGSPTYAGATTIASSISESGKKYNSSTGSENALLAQSGNSTLKKITVNKTGDADGEDSDFYGTNAGVLAYEDATLNISGAQITTAAAHANAVFAYGSGTINLADSTIKTTGNNSGAVMVTGGGTLSAKNVTAETDGNSSAPIRSDRGGGILTVTGGSYTSNGKGSPAIYSTADITVDGAKLTSTSSEGVVIEGKNSVTLKKTTLTDTNNSLNGNSETYKNIFIYQSMSGDADEGAGSFSATDSTITTNKGDSFFVTNTTALISLVNNTIVNNDKTGAFLRVQSGKWGNEGSNGGDVTLQAQQQEINGDIIADSISSVTMQLSKNSTFTGTINGDKSAKNVSLSLDSSSVITLTGDSYLSSLENESSDNANINLNGHTLYVNGKAITETAYQEQATRQTTTATQAQDTAHEKNSTLTYIIIAVLAIVAVTGAVVFVVLKSKKTKKQPQTTQSQEQAPTTADNSKD